MVKPAEVRQVLAHNKFHVALMLYTAVMVVVTDFLSGVLSAVVIWAIGARFVDKSVPVPEQALAQS
jgi:MFS superfamily sulfate permease-like transporter